MTKIEYAVEPKSTLVRVLREYGGLPETSPRWRALTGAQLVWLESEMRDFAVPLKVAMATLPDSPAYQKLGPEEIKPLWAALIPVLRSAKILRRAIRIWRVATKTPRKLGEIERELWRASEEGRRFTRLDSWLYRQTTKGKAATQKYYAKPEVKERLAKRPRETKEEAAARIRRAYWLKRGYPEPPPKSPGWVMRDEIKSTLDAVGFNDSGVTP